MAVERVDAVVVGAGVVGLAIARALSLAGREVLILEAEREIVSHASARNSEVIHAGIYYAPGSLKARACLAGKAALYRFCAERGVAHQRLGKLIVAAKEDELETLQRLNANAKACGLDDLQMLSAQEAAALEPEVRCAGALFSPSSGIIDSHAYALALLGEAEAHGAVLARQARVTGGSLHEDGAVLEVAGAEAMSLGTNLVVNAAGAGAQALARALMGGRSAVPPLALAKGSYFALTGRSPFSHLVYPAPIAGGLGVHATLDLGGRCRFGPDVEWVECADDYAVDPTRAGAFYDAVRRYWPGLPDGALAPDYAGVRAKIGLDAEAGVIADFRIEGPRAHGCGPIINLFGIDSPGLTASLALADHVAALPSQGRPTEM